MGRILDTLKHTAHRSVTPEASGAPRISQSPPGIEPESPTEVPYIEVGARGTAVEGSAAVLAAVPASTRFAPGAGAAPSGLVKAVSATVALGQPLKVAYHPLPASSRREPAQKHLASSLIAFHQPNHAASMQYRSLLANLTAESPGRAAQVVLLLALTSGSGATTAILNLAITRARQTSKPVVVVDANLRRPTMADMLGLPPGPGLREVAARSTPLAEALRETAQSGLMALTAGETLDPTATWPSQEAFRAVIQPLRSQFDWVLVDAPCWDGGPETVSLTTVCDAVYLVLRCNEVDSPEVTELTRLISHVGGRLGGYILTKQ
jgi:protein-tyrosine kinase